MRPTVQAIKDQKRPQEQAGETILEEVEGQERLPIMEMTTKEAAEIILNLCDELGKKGRDREGIALTKALMSLYTMDDLRKAANESHIPLRSFLDKCIATLKEEQ